MSRAGKYSMEPDAQALRWRHQRIMRALEHGEIDYAPAHRVAGVQQMVDGRPTGAHLVPGFTPHDALMLVVWPEVLANDDELGEFARRFLEASLTAVTEREAAAA